MSISKGISDQLKQIASATYFDEAASPLTVEWTNAGVGVEAIEPVLRFMEANPDIEFGSPGSLVHFIERFYRRGYEAQVVASIARRPTEHTVWLLNRLINGAQDEAERRALTGHMRAVANHPQADSAAIEAAAHFLS